MNSPVWYPYAQMKNPAPPLEVESASGAVIRLKDGRELLDAISSWWCVIHGYNHPEITAAAEAQMRKVPHVMMGGLIHESTARLAEKLVEITPPGLNHVFFGDSGSVGVEIALKMAMQFWLNQGKRKTKFIALKKAYHGDTSGCMSVCDPENGMHAMFSGIVPEQFFLAAPEGGFDAPEETIGRQMLELEILLDRNHEQIAAMIVEPLVQAAGGYNIYSPKYLQRARELCDKFDVLMIFDEVATGFGRTGEMFAADLAQVTPDIMVLGKALTAGYAGHSATLASAKVFSAFYDDDPGKCFMHGPTFMGNATVCAVALKSIELIERNNCVARVREIEKILRERFGLIASPRIRDVRVLGGFGVVEVNGEADYRGFAQFAVERGVWFRPFGRCIYTVPPYIVTDEQLHKIADVIAQWFAE